MTTTRERDKWKKFFNWADSEVAKANERLQAENADLRARLEKAERERDTFQKQYYNALDLWTKVEKVILGQEAENAVLKQKLEGVREWVKLYDPDWDNDINKLKKILDWE